MTSDRTTVALDGWTVIVRINRAGNLAVEVFREEGAIADFTLQKGGVIDVAGDLEPWPLGTQGWDSAGPHGFRKWRYGPSGADSNTASSESS